MTIPENTWDNYINGLRRVNDAASGKVIRYLETHAVETKEQMNAFIDYCYAISSTYGEGAAALACEMYDAVAIASKAGVPAAIPAEVATYGDVAKSVYGTMAQSSNANLIGNAIGRLVKRTGVDTTMNNAIRDGAEWAWIPKGDTCPFCIMLASQGWQKASKNAMKGGHAEHIHANCDCTYAIRFNNKTNVAGYTPDAYLEEYKDAEGSTTEEKLNYIRRQNYANNREKILEQKKTAYQKRKELNSSKAEEQEV